MGLHHIGRLASAVEVGVVQPGLGGDVLPQVIGPHVHQLAGVQGASALLGTVRRVGGAAGKVEADLVVGQHAPGKGHVAGCRVPGEYGVQAAEAALPGHEALAKAVLLSGAAEELHCTGRAGGLQPLLDDDGRPHRAGAQRAVAAAMSPGFPGDGTGLRHARLLAQAGEGVVLAQDADDRAPAPEGGLDGGGDAAGALRHLEPLLPQRLHNGPAALLLLVAALRRLPDPAVQVGYHGKLPLGRAAYKRHIVHARFSFRFSCTAVQLL